ncbi:hypothetical protein CANINC_000336 [Pichia inconspicua]|uniref:Uncharacterized protein n=1 Tax=Pichia inconspicua TaxID=52247 RepID=A0A4T0X7Z7_9ASCO|nr:hypothetical protein CANINC_000336 [[Candida] inconspicua]
MAATNTMLKTLVFGLAGLYVIKVVTDTAPPKVTASSIQDKVNNANHNHNHINNHALPVYDSTEKSLQDLKKYVVSAGSDASQKAMGVYEDAYKKVLDAKKELEAKAAGTGSNRGWGWGLFWASKSTPDDVLKKKYDDAVENYEKMKKNIGSYGEPLQAKGEELGNKAQAKGEELGNKAQGYIERAKGFFKDRYSDLTNNKEFASDQLKESVRYYNQQAADAKAEWDATKGSWLRWRRAQSQEVQDRAEAKYNYFKAKNDEAVNQLVEYLKSTGEDAKQVLQDLTSQAKDKFYDAKGTVDSYAGDAKDRLVNAGYNAKGAVEDNAEYAKHYAAGVKDRVDQAGYDAKEAAKDNAEYAKHYAAGVKDRVEQAGYDAKEAAKDNAAYAQDRIQDQVQYVKDSAVDAKDKVAKAGEDTKHVLHNNAAYIRDYVLGVKDEAYELGKDAKENIEDNAAYVKDKAYYAGKNVKESVEDNAAYAKGKVADAKDSVVDNAAYAKDKAYYAGKDLKESVEDNAAYAKEKLADAKDSVVDNAAYAKDKAYYAGKDLKESVEDNAAYAKDQAYDAGSEAKKNAEGIIAGASKWLKDTGSATKHYFSDKYNSLWNNLGVFTAKNQEVAEEAVKYYDEEVRKAKAEYEATLGGWFGLKSPKPQVVQNAAREKLEILKAKDEAARRELARWKTLNDKT